MLFPFRKMSLWAGLLRKAIGRQRTKSSSCLKTVLLVFEDPVAHQVIYVRSHFASIRRGTKIGLNFANSSKASVLDAIDCVSSGGGCGTGGILGHGVEPLA